MITQETAINIAREYAERSGRGWDNRYHEAIPSIVKGEPVWIVSTCDMKFSKELPWMMEHMPNPVCYFISMVNAKCIAVGRKVDEYLQIDNGE